MRQADKIIAKKIQLPFKVRKTVLAFGSQTKNTLCFARGNFAYLSRMHADLISPEDFSAFKQAAKYFLKKQPEVIACDLHPEYESSKFARGLLRNTCRPQLIQHHHAHIAGCMAENGLANQRVIGVAFDGTGLGTDNKLWGAEFLVCDYRDFKRQAHLKEIPLLGAEKAILQPWRLAAAWLYAIYKDRFLSLGIDFVRRMDKNKWQVLKKMYLSGFNAPLSSSAGRLFDAVASLVSAEYKVTKEAELAMALEELAIRQLSLRGSGATEAIPKTRLLRPFGARNDESFFGVSNDDCAIPYIFAIIKHEESYVLDPSPMFKGIVKDLKAGAPKEKIAYRFHVTCAQMIKNTCCVLRKRSGINRVVLSGGVFQNKLLLSLSSDLLYKDGFKIFTHKELSCNDSALSLGQAAIAANRS